MFDLCHKATVEIFTHTGSMALFTGTIRVSRYQKGKSMWILLKQDNSQWQLHQLGRMQICISLQADNRASTPTLIFTARCYASAVLAMGLCLSVSVFVSVTSRCSTKTAKRRITKTTAHDTPVTLVFWCQRFPRNSTGVTPYEGAECRWGGSKSATFDQ